MSVEHVEARAGAYADSVTLMQVSDTVRHAAGVEAAMVAMATELNLGLLTGLGFPQPDGAGPNHLLVAVRASGQPALVAALALAERGLTDGSDAGVDGPGADGGTDGTGTDGVDGAAATSNAGVATGAARTDRASTDRAGTDGASADGASPSVPERAGTQAAGAGGSGQAATAGVSGQVPRTVSAAAWASGPGLALISVPGEHAFTEALDALDAGCDVMIFSDNVSVRHEITLKEIAAERGLLVMGPDCGTAVVGGVGLGFSHTLAHGSVGLVAASGTGAQQVLCLLDAAGVGVSAALGVGGRDLSAAVRGRAARAALTALDADPATSLILVVSKTPDPQVAASVQAFAGALSTPVQFAMIGPGEPDLTSAAEGVLRTIGATVPEWPHWAPAGPAAEPGTHEGALRGLFAGGTLCTEAMVIASEKLGTIRSNIPLQPEWDLDPQASCDGHTMIDFGDDRLTTGRPHPMIDQSLRLARLGIELQDPATAVVLMDVVLGHAAHPDPAAEIAPLIAAARADRPIPVVVSLVGARADPQVLDVQAFALMEAGAHVLAANADAARFACSLIADGSHD